MMTNYEKGTQILKEIKSLGVKPKLLLHVCCGPCSTYPLELLKDYFYITIYFNNSNIYPKEEYFHRKEELYKYVNYLNDNFESQINIVETQYDYDSYITKLDLRKNDPENGPRCKLCYWLRMNEACKYAYENNFDYFTTVMSISRQKDEKVINRIGKIIANKYPSIKFLPHNFKKKGGQIRRDEIVKSLNMYDQNYCGCKYSIREEKK